MYHNVLKSMFLLLLACRQHQQQGVAVLDKVAFHWLRQGEMQRSNVDRGMMVRIDVVFKLFKKLWKGNELYRLASCNTVERSEVSIESSRSCL